MTRAGSVDEFEDLKASKETEDVEHWFFGTVQVDSLNCLSDVGCKILTEKGADLGCFSNGEFLFVKIRGKLHRYEHAGGLLGVTSCHHCG